MEGNRLNSRDDRSEVLLRFFTLAKNTKAFRGKTIEEVLKNETNIREAINSLTFEEFIELLDGVNGILRHQPKESWKMDGKEVTLSSMLLGTNAPPQFKDKLDLLQKVLSGAKEMNANNRSLEDIGILLGIGISEIHPYNDANGRTGRLFYTLLSWGMNKDKIREVLSDYGRDSADFDVQYIKSIVQENIQDRVLTDNIRNFTNLFYNSLSNLDFDSAIPESTKESFLAFLEANSGSVVLALAVYEWVKENKKDGVFQEFGERSVINLNWLAPKLNETASNKTIIFTLP